MAVDHGIDTEFVGRMCQEIQASRSAGDPDSLRAGRLCEDRLVCHCEPMCRKFARYFSRVYGVPEEDCRQECRIGVMLACRKFDSALASFPFYASLWSRRRIQRLKLSMKTLKQDDDGQAEDTLTEEKEAPPIREPIDLAPVLDLLTPTQRHVVERVHGLDGHPACTMKTLASQLGLTRPKVSAIYAEAVAYIRSQILIPYHG